MKILIRGSTQLSKGKTLADLLSMDRLYKVLERFERYEELNYLTPDKVSVLESAMKDPDTALPKVPSKYQEDYYVYIPNTRYNKENDTFLLAVQYRVSFGGEFYWVTRNGGEVSIDDNLTYMKYTEIEIHSDNSYDISTRVLVGKNLEKHLSVLTKFEASPDGMYIVSKRDKDGWFSGICRDKSQIEDLVTELNNGRPIKPQKFRYHLMFK